MSRLKCAAQKYVEKKMECLIGWMWVVEHVFLCSKFQKVCGTCNSLFQAPEVNLWKSGFTELCSICCGVLDDFFPACWSARLERHVAIMHKLSYNEFQHDSFLLGVAKWIGFVNILVWTTLMRSKNCSSSAFVNPQIILSTQPRTRFLVLLMCWSKNK